MISAISQARLVREADVIGMAEAAAKALKSASKEQRAAIVARARSEFVAAKADGAEGRMGPHRVAERVAAAVGTMTGVSESAKAQAVEVALARYQALLAQASRDTRRDMRRDMRRDDCRPCIFSPCDANIGEYLGEYPQAGGGYVSEEWLCDALERAVGALASASEAERERAVAATKISAGWRVGTRFRGEIVSEKAKVTMTYSHESRR